MRVLLSLDKQFICHLIERISLIVVHSLDFLVPIGL